MTTVTRASMMVLFRYTVFGLLISSSKSETLHSYNLISSFFYGGREGFYQFVLICLIAKT